MTSVAETPAQISPRHGFDSLSEETHIEGLPVTGAMPPWLQGSLLRTGPAKWEVGERTMEHWFDGLAMLHRFSFADGRVSYANRFLETRRIGRRRRRAGSRYSEFATDPCRSLYQRITAMFSPKLTDNANVNLVKLGERFIAMTETPIPVQFDADTLGAAGVAYDVPGQLTTAHPHMDRATKGMLNYAAKLGPRASYRFFLLASGSGEAERSSPPGRCRAPAYMHSFGLTERWFVLAEFPYVVNPPSLAFSGRPYIENYRWRPELGTRFQLFDRTHRGEHRPVRDRCALRLPPRQRLRGRRRRRGRHLHLRRRRDRRGPLPRAAARGQAPRRAASRAVHDLHREGHGRHGAPDLRADGAAAHQLRPLQRAPLPLRLGRRRRGPQLARPDREGRRHHSPGLVWHEEGCFPGEPVFVAAPEREDEDEGVLLSVVFDAARGNSFMLVLDARTLEEVAGRRSRTTSRSGSTASSRAPRRGPSRAPGSQGGRTPRSRRSGPPRSCPPPSHG